VRTTSAHREQAEAIRELNARFPQVKIRFHLDGYVPHDRMIEVTRADETQARVLIGLGLDFIADDGTVRDTFLVFQNGYVIQ
jgi:hypothetical protein